jgi:hypothetical protein
VESPARKSHLGVVIVLSFHTICTVTPLFTRDLLVNTVFGFLLLNFLICLGYL